MYIKKKGTFISLHWFWFILYIYILVKENIFNIQVFFLQIKTPDTCKIRKLNS